MKINEKLKFSWGHIIAFLAMVFLCYVTFLGTMYLPGADYIIAAAVTLGVLVITLIFFIVPQLLKGTESKFSKKVVWERILIFSSPVLLLAAMFPFSHFWTVFDNRKELETGFSESLVMSKEIFTDYETYGRERIRVYSDSVALMDIPSQTRYNKVEALRLQIGSIYYEDLRNDAILWIDQASKASVWNVFMLANIQTINTAIDGWAQRLTEWAGVSMSDECPSQDNTFEAITGRVASVKESLDKLTGIYTDVKLPSWYFWAMYAFTYLLLLFPYMIQKRHTKSMYATFSSKKAGHSGIEVKEKVSGRPSSHVEHDQYGSFKL